MKSFVVVAFIVASIIVQTLAAPMENAEEAANVEVMETVPEEEAADNVRFRKSAYGPSYGSAGGSSGSMAAAGSGRPAGFGGMSSMSGIGQPITYTYPSVAPTVPCGRNLLFSCQPNVAPVPCVAPAPAPGPIYSGAYSEPVPQWVYPVV